MLTEASHTEQVLLSTPGAFTKRANIRALLGALSLSPVIGAGAGLHSSGGTAPVESTVGGAIGGTLGGVTGAGVGGAASLLLALLKGGKFDPAMLTSAATLAGVLGAIAGGKLGSGGATRASGASQEALLAAILDETRKQGQGHPRAFRADLLR